MESFNEPRLLQKWRKTLCNQLSTEYHKASKTSNEKERCPFFHCCRHPAYPRRKNKHLKVRQSCVCFYFSQTEGLNFRVLCCPAFSRVTCLAWMSVRVVSVSSLAPVETIYVLFPAVVWIMAFGGDFPSLGMSVPSRR